MIFKNSSMFNTVRDYTLPAVGLASIAGIATIPSVLSAASLQSLAKEQGGNDGVRRNIDAQIIGALLGGIGGGRLGVLTSRKLQAMSNNLPKLMQKLVSPAISKLTPLVLGGSLSTAGVVGGQVTGGLADLSVRSILNALPDSMSFDY